MPTVATLAASSSAAASRRSLNPSRFLAPAVAAAACFGSKYVNLDKCTKTLKAFKLSSRSSVIECESKLPPLPRLSISSSSHGPNQQLHAFSFKEKSLSHLSTASTAFFSDKEGPVLGIPKLPRNRRSPQPPRAIKNEVFGFKYPVITEKPEWWWRTLACVPYLIALQISDAGFYLQPFLEHYEFFGDLIYFVPGAITRLPAWFSMIYLYFAYVGIVKKKEWPHYFRFHLMMGMLLETALQVIWYTSNFFPLIHYTGTLGMHYWAGVGLAYIVILLQCVRCALAGGYANVPLISDAAYVHTLFNIGGFQRPF